MPYNALSPLDGRYAYATDNIRALWSESALMRYRVHVECSWFEHLCACTSLPE